MKKFVLLVLISSVFTAHSNYNLSANNITANISDFSAKKSGSGYDIAFNINHTGFKKEFFDDSRVVISTEKYRISGYPESDIISENDFLFSRFSFDLDGDSKSESKIKISNRDGSTYLNGKKINQILSKKNFGDFIISDYLENSQIKTARLNENAASFLLYSYDSKSDFITFGLGDKDNPIAAEFFPNPCVEIIIAQETDSISKIPACRISGQAARTRISNELIFSGQEWIISETWTAIPYQPGKKGREEMKINISEVQKPFAVILSVKFSLKEGVTLSSKRLINIID